MNPSRSRLAILEHINSKILSLGLVAALLMPVALLLMAGMTPAVKASPGWWNSNWIYRRPITISGPHPENYQIKIVLDKVDNLGRHCLDNFQDIRFLENESSGELSFWIENYISGDNAIIWVRRVENSDNTIYVYYGNPSAVNAGSENAVFDYIDRGDQVASWTFAGSSGQSGIEGNPAPSYYAVSTNGSYMYRNINLVPRRILTFNVKSNGLGNLFFLVNSSGAGQMYRLDSRGGQWSGFATTSNWTSWEAPSSGFQAATNIWYKLTIVTTSLTSATLYYKQTTDSSPFDFGTLLGTYTITNNGGFIGLVGDALGSGYTTWWDSIIVRKYNSPEPSCTVGAEEVAIPSQPQLQQPGKNSYTNDNTPTFQWIVGENADNHRILVDNDGNLLSPVDNVLLGAANNTWTKPNPGYADGTYYWEVIAIKGGENSSDVWNFIIDTASPSKPTLVLPENNRLDNVLARTLTWTRPEPNVTYHIQIDNETSFASPYMHENTMVSENTYSYTFSSGGTYYWRVRAKDSANNWSVWADNFKLTIDVTPPSIPSLISPNDGENINDNTPALDWSDVSDSSVPITYGVQVDNDFDFSSPAVNVTSLATSNYTTPELTEGVWYWRANARDNVGNVGNWSASKTFIIDTTPPSKPTLVSPENNRLDNVLARTLTWTRPEPNVTYHIQIDNGSGFSPPYVYENTTVGGNTYNYVFSTGGTYYWRVRAKDQASNWSSWSDNFKLVIDVTAPSAPTLLEPSDGAATNDATPTFRWNAVSDPSTPVTYFIQSDNDSNFSSPEINFSGLIDNTYTPTVTLADENYWWRVRVRDNAGNWGAWSSTWTLLIDTIVETPMLLEPSNGTKINDNNPTFGWTIVSDNSPPVTYDLMVDNDSDFTSPEINVSGLSDNTYTPTSELADENYSWRIRARDDLGNISPWSLIWTFMIDTVPPEAPTLLTPVDGTITDDNTPILICLTVDDTSNSGTGEASGVRYYEFWVDNDLDFASPEILENLTISTHTTATELPGENYSWRVRAWDSAGNPGPFSSVWTLVIENFSISADPESLEIMRGTKGTVRLSVVKDYGPSENAVLGGSWIVDLPDDLTTSFAPAENKMPFESTLTFDIGSSASPGIFTYLVRATSDSGMSHTTDVEVTIVSTIFTVSSYPRALELMRGDTATSTVSVDYLLGKKETVFLSGSWIGAAPTGVVASFSLQNGLPPFRSTLMVTTGKNATAGSFTYRVTGNGGGLTRTDDIIVGIATNLALTLSTDNTSYEKGQRIRIYGNAKDPKGNPVENGEATITLRSGKWTDYLVTRITDGKYSENYYITFDKPEGNWSISASAVDNRGNVGQSSENVIISVSIPAAWKYYTVTFLSPPPNMVCSRGQEVAVTVQITEGAEKISGANVYIATPSGEIITLAEGTPGIYSVIYAIRWDDPAGEWTVSVLGEKIVQGTYKAGTGFTSLDIAPADLKLELLEPSQRTFEVGDEVKIKVRVSYPDGSPVDGAIVAASLSDGENLTLLNEGEGTYRGTYSVSKKDLGAWNLAVSAIDAFGNSGTSSEVTLSFKELSPSSYPFRYWWITLPLVVACALIPIPTVTRKLRVRKLKLMNSEIRATEKLRKELPERYFLKGAISRETYDSLMNQSLEKLMKLKKDVGKLQKMLEKKGLP